MRILMATSELFPYSKTGGLADMVAGLAGALAQSGHEVRVVTPLYRGVRERFPELKPFDWHCELPMGSKRVAAGVWTTTSADGVLTYFVDASAYFGRPHLYQEDGHSYADNPERFIFFSKCVTHLARYLPWRPDVVHLHDWQVAMVPLLIRHQATHDHWVSPPRTCLTIHNLAYQGTCQREHFQLTNLPLEYFNADGPEFYGSFNPLKAGLHYADCLTTVSPSYAKEITTPEMGAGLDSVLRQRGTALSGILNGVDYAEWNTTRNPHLPHAYSADNLAGKAKNKAELQAALGLPVKPDVPLFASITRLAEQKGMTLLHDVLQTELEKPIQFVLLGEGDPGIEGLCTQLAQQHRDRVAVRIGYDNALAHRIEAGADFFLMPSKYEPCGLNQLYSLRYGTIPVVRATGGLKDSVVDIAQKPKTGTGVKFTDYTMANLAKAIQRAQSLYADKAKMAATVHRAMKADFSWQTSAGKYAKRFAALGADQILAATAVAN